MRYRALTQRTAPHLQSTHRAINRGWWHYAAALEPSLTAQCNFYSSPSNASALVKLIVEKGKLASKAQAVSGKPVQT